VTVSAADRAIRASATAAVLGVAVIAAYVSYWHAYQVIRSHGETGVTARLETATIDGLVYSSSMVVGKPISERRLAAMFGKTSRRWARHRMAEARQTPVSTGSDTA
jgi:hypothetical protein